MSNGAWILLIALNMPDGAVRWQVEGFISEAACEKAAVKVKSTGLRGSFGQPPQTVCIERRAP